MWTAADPSTETRAEVGTLMASSQRWLRRPVAAAIFVTVVFSACGDPSGPGQGSGLDSDRARVLALALSEVATQAFRFPAAAGVAGKASRPAGRNVVVDRTTTGYPDPREFSNRIECPISGSMVTHGMRTNTFSSDAGRTVSTLAFQASTDYRDCAMRTELGTVVLRTPFPLDMTGQSRLVGVDHRLVESETAYGMRGSLRWEFATGGSGSCSLDIHIRTVLDGSGSWTSVLEGTACGKRIDDRRTGTP